MKDPKYWLDEVGKGWHSLIEPIIAACIEENVEIFQIKEKFGSLRIYLKGDAPEYINQYIRYAEWMSERTCEYTGKPGKVRSVNGWLRCVCDEQYEELTRSEDRDNNVKHPSPHELKDAIMSQLRNMKTKSTAP